MDKNAVNYGQKCGQIDKIINCLLTKIVLVNTIFIGDKIW